MTHPAVDPKVIEAEENLLIDFHFLLQELMTEKGVSRSELAKKTGLSKARLTQVLSSEANPTIKSMARLFHALDEQLCLSRKPLSVEREERGPIPFLADGADWQWGTSTRAEERKDEKELARIVKETFASNDNYHRVMFIDSDLALTPEPDIMLDAKAA
jgi:transcriptional regulator with XRE-family HTH domain